MAVLNYTGWPVDVNKIILEQSSIKYGQNALKTDELENGHKRSRKRGYYVPDVYSIVMEFDWVNKKEDGKTEYQRFIEWYKYTHEYGAIPFEFPQIGYSAHTGILVYDSQEEAYFPVEYYKITSEVEGNKSGDCIQIKMTWETVYGGIINIGDPSRTINGIIKCKPTYMDISFSYIGNSEPTSQMFEIYANTQQIPMQGFMVNGSVVRIFYSFRSEGTVMTFSFNDQDIVVEAGTYKANVL